VRSRAARWTRAVQGPSDTAGCRTQKNRACRARPGAGTSAEDVGARGKDATRVVYCHDTYKHDTTTTTPEPRRTRHVPTRGLAGRCPFEAKEGLLIDFRAMDFRISIQLIDSPINVQSSPGILECACLAIVMQLLTHTPALAVVSWSRRVLCYESGKRDIHDNTGKASRHFART
jgi:hypothetical protein